MPNKGCVSLARLIAFAVHVQANFLGTSCGCPFSWLAALVVAARASWMKIAVRAIGSWLAAVSVLMLGWALRSSVT
jgi:hypothetical protein